jgi:hypothetical protein
LTSREHPLFQARFIIARPQESDSHEAGGTLALPVFRAKEKMERGRPAGFFPRGGFGSWRPSTEPGFRPEKQKKPGISPGFPSFPASTALNRSCQVHSAR